MVAMRSHSMTSRETPRAENPNFLAADFSPACIFAGGEAIVRFSITVAGNKERAQVLLPDELPILDCEVNIRQHDIVTY